MDHKTNATKLDKMLNSIMLSNSNTILTYVVVTLTDVPTNKQQANSLIKHFSHVCQLKLHPNDIQVTRHFPMGTNYASFSCRQTRHIIKNLQNSCSCGPDNISNISQTPSSTRDIGTH